MDPAMTGPFLIALEGPDGSGKTTQAARLVSWLGSLGCDVVACRDPGGTGIGDRLRSILLDRSELKISLRAELLLYMASRAQLVDEVIRPALDVRKIVVTDRFLLSNVVYQGYAGGHPADEIWNVGMLATGGLLPNLTLLVDVPPEVATRRTGGARDRIEDRPESYRQKVRQGFLTAAQTYPAPIVVVDGSGDADIVASQLQREVAHALGIDSRA